MRRSQNQRGRLHYSDSDDEELGYETNHSGDRDSISTNRSPQSAIERSRNPSISSIMYDAASMTAQDYLRKIYASSKDIQASMGKDGQIFRCVFDTCYPENLDVLCLGDRNAVRLIEIKLAMDQNPRDKGRTNRATSFGPTATIFNLLTKIRSWCLSDSFQNYKRYVIFAGMSDLELTQKKVEGKTLRCSSAGNTLLHIVAAIATRNPGALIYASMLIVPPKYRDNPLAVKFAASYNKTLGFLRSICPFLLGHKPRLLKDYTRDFVEEGDFFHDDYLEDFAWILDGNW